MDDSSSSSPAAASYIHLVHHLIEECLVFNMSKQECIEALSKHANIKPLITSTVWKELEKENKDFFEAYGRSKEDKDLITLTNLSLVPVQHQQPNTNIDT